LKKIDKRNGFVLQFPSNKHYSLSFQPELLGKQNFSQCDAMFLRSSRARNEFPAALVSLSCLRFSTADYAKMLSINNVNASSICISCRKVVPLMPLINSVENVTSMQQRERGSLPHTWNTNYHKWKNELILQADYRCNCLSSYYSFQYSQRSQKRHVLSRAWKLKFHVG